MFWRRKRSPEDISEEIRSHLELEADDLREEGLARSQATDAARRAFGNATALQEWHYERHRWLWWDHFLQDLRFSIRGLRRSPVFAIAAIATLALGIGANAAIFSVVNAVLLRALPYSHPERIVVLETHYKNAGKVGATVSAPDFYDWRSESQKFESMAYHYGGLVTAIANGTPSFVHARAVTPDFFSVFGLAPLAGRFWSSQENSFAVVSHKLAQQQFGTAEDALNKNITVWGKSLQVIGVASPGFEFPGKCDVWLPAEPQNANQHRGGHNYLAIGRLKATASLESARREMRAIAERLEKHYPEDRFKSVAVTPLHEKLAVSAKTTLWVLLGAVFVVLLIACANVANLQLARVASRNREMALRSALGAARGRILRQVLTESLLLTFAGSAAGLALAVFLLKAVLAVAPPGIPGLDQVRIDGPVLLFVLALACVCCILFGLAPARRSAKSDLNLVLRQNSATGAVDKAGWRTRSFLVVAEVALSVILLAGAGLLLRSFIALTRADLGFTTERLLLAGTSIPVKDEIAVRRATEFQRGLIERAQALPGVLRAAGFMTRPFAASRSTVTYSIEGGPAYRPGEEPGAQVQVVTPGYFETLGIAVLRGRDFTNGDAWERPQVVIVNESLARATFGRESPLGRRISCGMTKESAKGMEIIGVVSDARQVAPGETPQPEIFLPYLQHPRPGANLTLAVQTKLEPLALSSALRQLLREMNPAVPVRFTTMSEVLSEALAYPRFRGLLIGCFALLALCLAMVGIYGVLSYLVGQRTCEIGLRFALGARPRDVFRFLIGGSMRLVGWGLVLGLAGTLALSRVLKSFLYGVGPQDPFTLAGVLGVLVLVALLGSGVPAMRAARLDPVVALRHE